MTELLGVLLVCGLPFAALRLAIHNLDVARADADSRRRLDDLRASLRARLTAPEPRTPNPAPAKP
jgi:hypothetical protein